MPTRAEIIVKPEMGPYLFKQVQKYQDTYFKETHRAVSDAAIAEQAGMTAETFRRIKAGIASSITIASAIRLIQIFRDPHLADFLEYPQEVRVSRRGPNTGRTAITDADSLVIAALAPTLTGRQKEYAKRLILFLLDKPDASPGDLDEDPA